MRVTKDPTNHPPQLSFQVRRGICYLLFVRKGGQRERSSDCHNYELV